VTLVVCLCACLLAAMAYLAYRAWLQAQKIQRLANERLRLETELALQARELQESNRALEEALRKLDELQAGRRVEESTAADVIDVTSPVETPYGAPESPGRHARWSSCAPRWSAGALRTRPPPAASLHRAPPTWVRSPSRKACASSSGSAWRAMPAMHWDCTGDCAPHIRL